MFKKENSRLSKEVEPLANEIRTIGFYVKANLKDLGLVN